jgi:hypothetical protein
MSSAIEKNLAARKHFFSLAEALFTTCTASFNYRATRDALHHLLRKRLESYDN